MVYAKFGGQTECIMGNWKIENVKIIRLRLRLGRGWVELHYGTGRILTQPPVRPRNSQQKKREGVFKTVP